MRKLALVLVISAACGSSKQKAKEDAGVGSDARDAPADASTLPACANPVHGTNIQAVHVTKVVGGAMLVTSPPADPRLFIIEQRGAIRIFDQGQLLPDPFLDISDSIAAGGEQGLLGLAFHPGFASNGLFFVDYTTDTADIVAKCHVNAATPNVADPTCTPILTIPDFAGNHNGGMIEFGKDGFLYIGTGDGGLANDPALNGQALNDGTPCPGAANCGSGRTSQAWLGKMLRIDVDHPAGGNDYGIPADNPYAAGGGKPEIFAIGLRNPWRWSFDTKTGDVWIGDVGQGTIEEIDFVPAGQLAGKNFGWSMYEGANCFHAPCDATGKFVAQDQRTHTAGWVAIIGGQVYRGTCYPDINGWYFYTDNGHRVLTRAIAQPDGSLDTMELPGTWPASPASIHADARGELYMTTTSGDVYRLEASP